MAIEDDIDRQLIRLLEKDARQSSEQLAKKLAVSSTTVRRRLRRLIQQGVLRIVAVVEPKKAGVVLHWKSDSQLWGKMLQPAWGSYNNQARGNTWTGIRIDG